MNHNESEFKERVTELRVHASGYTAVYGDNKLLLAGYAFRPSQTELDNHWRLSESHDDTQVYTRK